jgi:small subunit ribosomal protein S20
LAGKTSAEKAAKQDRRNAERNRPVRTSVRSAVTKARKLILERDFDAAKEAVKAATQELDIAAKKGVIHPNNAARRKSRLVRQLNTAMAGGGVEVKPVKAAKAKKVAKAAEPVEAAEAVEATEAVETTEPVEVAEPVEATEATEPAEDTKAVETTEPAEATEAVEETKEE